MRSVLLLIMTALLVHSADGADAITEQCGSNITSADEILDVIVVGNGPSALALGALLQHEWVVERGAPHVSSGALKRAARSLAGADLGSVGGNVIDNLGGKLSARCVSPTSALVDALRFPVSDGGGQSLLDVRRRGPGSPTAAIIGRGPPGGSWHDMPGETLTLSPAEWMALPGMAWTAKPTPSGRATRGASAAYFEAYARDLLVPGTSVRGNVVSVDVRERVWHVHGTGPTLRARALVLAGGAYDVPRRLGIPGEDLPAVSHRAPAPRRARLLVVGAGLSATDAVLRWIDAGGTVVHVFRTAAVDTRLYKMFGGNYSPSYAGECSLAALAAGEKQHPAYLPVSGAQLTAVHADRTVDLVDASSVRRLKDHGVFDAVAILIGGAPALDFLPASILKRLPSEPLAPGTKLDGTPGTHPKFLHVDTVTGLVTDSNGEILHNDPPLYALGPLRGDNFVRFVVGDAAAVANDLRRRSAERKCSRGDLQDEC